ncbi:pleckstrin homology domain-containing family A member 1-like [Corticium candelabrum]|uniref:pleckstrin homology domain-containing family A member 1-like n=1 Tax=Corticium candelabrum TaxID=121492 RepID=UPI002E255106|nr:pleckstrin homology domain-containing family A member 1-like [Corticium candelabrum]
MPYRDKDGRLCGYLDQEIDNTRWSSRFFILDGPLLRIYRKEPQNLIQEKEFLSELNTKYVTKIAVCKVRPKKQYCFEIGTPQQTNYFECESHTEMDEWIEALKQATVPKRSGSTKIGASATASNSGTETKPADVKKADVNYQTKVVGGVVVRTPIRTSCEDSDETLTTKPDIGLLKRPDRLRIIKAGYCVKLGAKVKNWKQRYFILDPVHFSYYKTPEDREAIRSVPVNDIKDAKQLIGFQNKDNLFEVVTPGRTFLIQAESQEELHGWLKALSSTITGRRGQLSSSGVL